MLTITPIDYQLLTIELEKLVLDYFLTTTTMPLCHCIMQWLQTKDIIHVTRPENED